MSVAEQVIRGAFHDALALEESSRCATDFANILKKAVITERRKQKKFGTKRMYQGNFVGFKGE